MEKFQRLTDSILDCISSMFCQFSPNLLLRVFQLQASIPSRVVICKYFAKSIHAIGLSDFPECFVESSRGVERNAPSRQTDSKARNELVRNPQWCPGAEYARSRRPVEKDNEAAASKGRVEIAPTLFESVRVHLRVEFPSAYTLLLHLSVLSSNRRPA